MTLQGWILILGFVAILLALAKPVGAWLFALYEGRRTPLHLVLGPVERGFYKLSGIDPTQEQGWRHYAVHMLLFNAALMFFTYGVLRLQACRSTRKTSARSVNICRSTRPSALPPTPTGKAIVAR